MENELNIVDDNNVLNTNHQVRKEIIDLLLKDIKECSDAVDNTENLKERLELIHMNRGRINSLQKIIKLL